MGQFDWWIAIANHFGAPFTTLPLPIPNASSRTRARTKTVADINLSKIRKTVNLVESKYPDPDFIKTVLPVGKCHLEDSSCMISAFQKALPVYFSGIPEMGIEVHDVLEMDDFKFDLSGLQFSLQGGKLKGLKDSVIDDVKWDLKKQFFKVTFHLDCSVTGQYTAAGKILVLPINGDGDLKLKAKNMQLTLSIPYEIQKGSDNKDHIVPKKLDFDFVVKDNVYFDLTNLFNGNKELSDAMLKFLNENWQAVATEFGKPIIEAAVKKILKNLKIFFRKNAIGDIAEI